MSQSLDKILELIDRGLATAPSASDMGYAPHGTESDQCWRCLSADPTGDSGLCDECRRILTDEEFSTGVYSDAALVWRSSGMITYDSELTWDCSGIVTTTLHTATHDAIGQVTITGSGHHFGPGTRLRIEGTETDLIIIDDPTTHVLPHPEGPRWQRRQHDTTQRRRTYLDPITHRPTQH